MGVLYDLTKVLPQLLYPTAAVIWLTALAMLLLLSGWRRSGLLLGAVTLAGFALAASPVVSEWLRGSLEQSFPPRPSYSLPEADVIIALGGGLSPVAPPRLMPDLDEAADRLWYAAELWHAGRAPRVVLTGGNQPWLPAARSAAADARRFVERLGVPAHAIGILGEPRNTYEEAVAVGELSRERGWNAALLVSSALHLCRAMAVFRGQGVPVIAAPTDIEVVSRTARHPMRWLPEAGALDGTTEALREHLGFWLYRGRGWMGNGPVPDCARPRL